jgi:hypothetical protein
MRAYLTKVVALLALLSLGAPALGQQQTERYIPLGQSPGLSGKVTLIGEIAAIDDRSLSLTVSTPQGPRPVKVTDRTRIWIDRSLYKMTNLTGRFADLKTGNKVEVLFAEDADRHVARWIKMQPKEPPDESPVRR